ncbi:hypothetical protein Pelo_11758 [Pelomyxa schiedti]|nr:hypothetical protein Pelo_11758 [Pelomyxa schiedti]
MGQQPSVEMSDLAPALRDNLLSLKEAVKNGDAQLVTRLLEDNPNIDIHSMYRWESNSYYYSSLLHEAGSGSVAMVLLHPPHPHKPLTATNINQADAGGDTPLWRACMFDVPGVAVQLLACPGIDPNKGARGALGSYSPLHAAMHSGGTCKERAGMVEVMLSHPGTDVNRLGYENLTHPAITTPLAKALLVGHMKSAQLILRHGGKVNKESEEEVYKAMGGRANFLQWVHDNLDEAIKTSATKPLAPEVPVTPQVEIEAESNVDKLPTFHAIEQENAELRQENAELKKLLQTRTREINDLAQRLNDLEEVSQENAEIKVRLNCLSEECSKFEVLSRACLMLEIQQFNSVQLLSCGSYGAVFSAKHPKIPFQVCLKFMMDMSATQNPSPTVIRNKYRSEVRSLSFLPSHKNILHPICTFFATLPESWIQQIKIKYPVYAEWSQQRSLVILMPHGGTTLDKFLAENPSTPISEVISLLKQALLAVAHLTKNFTVHRDIKGDNILVRVSTTTGGTNQLNLSLIDFGLSVVTEHNQQMTVSIDLTREEAWGNPFTLPPDISRLVEDANLNALTQRDTGASRLTVVPYQNADSFAVAMVFWKLLCTNPQALINRSQSDFTLSMLPPLRPDVISYRPQTIAILQGMLHPDHTQRLSALDVLSNRPNQQNHS